MARGVGRVALILGHGSPLRLPRYGLLSIHAAPLSFSFSFPFACKARNSNSSGDSLLLFPEEAWSGPKRGSSVSRCARLDAEREKESEKELRTPCRGSSAQRGSVSATWPCYSTATTTSSSSSAVVVRVSVIAALQFLGKTCSLSR